MKLVHPRNTLPIRCVVVFFVTAVTTGALLPPAGAAEPADATTPVTMKGSPAKISKDHATQNALVALPGTVTDVTVEKKRGKNVWVIEIVAEKTGAETDVLVDMDSGLVLGMEH